MLGWTLTLCLRVTTAIAVVSSGVPGLACVCPGCVCCGAQADVDAGAASCCGGHAANDAPVGRPSYSGDLGCCDGLGRCGGLGDPSECSGKCGGAAPSQHRCGCCIQASPPAVAPGVSLPVLEHDGSDSPAAFLSGSSTNAPVTALVASSGAWRMSRGHPPHTRPQSVLCVWVI